MDKPRNQDVAWTPPHLDGPDYLSLVIEWEEPVMEPADEEVTTKQMRDWDVVDEASLESFPASDPPGYYSSVAASSSETAAEGVEQLSVSRWPIRLRNILMAITAIGGLFALVQHLRHRRA